MEQTIPFTYGELKLEALCSIAPPDPSVGIKDPIIDIEELRAPELNSIYVDDFIMDRFDKDAMFKGVIESLVKQAAEKMRDNAIVEAKLAEKDAA